MKNPDSPPRRHRLRRLIILALIGWGVTTAVRKFLGDVDDSWTPYRPSQPYQDHTDTTDA